MAKALDDNVLQNYVKASRPLMRATSCMGRLSEQEKKEGNIL